MESTPAPRKPEEPRRRRRLTRPPAARPTLPDEGPRPAPLPATKRGTEVARAPRERGYDDHQIVKSPPWTWEIPLYFFVGGLSGGMAILAFAGLLAGASRELLLTALWIASGAVVISPLLLISDLQRPARFYNMLRVLKWRSPMSVGAWLLTSYAPTIVVATLVFALSPWLVAELGWPPTPLRALLWVSLAIAAVLGALLSTYTAVLIGVTAVPAWAARRHILPLHFGAASLGAAAALLELFFRVPPLWAVGAAAAVVETFVLGWLEVTKRGDGGRRDAAVREGRSGRWIRVSGSLSGPVSLGLRLFGLVLLADLAFLVGALASRYAWLHVGRASAEDPAAALDEG